VLVVAEAAILFAGVVARFGFHGGLVWSDELASILFLWLAMLGAVVAMQRGEHMRLTAIATRLPPAWQRRAEVFSFAVAALFLALILWPALGAAQDDMDIETPALAWSGAIRTAAIPAGCALMLLSALLRLARARLTDAALVALVLAAVAGALYLGAGWLTALALGNLVVFFGLLLGAAVLLGVPIGFAFGAATLASLATTTTVPLSVVVSRLDEGMSTLILLAVPMFVLLGQVIEAVGMAEAMVAFLAALVGHVRGGLAWVLLGAMYLVSGISGAKAADMAAVAPVLFPQMRRRGVPEGELVALLSAAAAMSETIAPSLVLITIGSVTGVSISALFAGGLLPALVLALALGALARWRAGDEEVAAAPRASWGATGRAFVVALPGLVLPVLIRAATVGGIATATEVSTLGIAYAACVAVVARRRVGWRRLTNMLVETASLSGAILFIIGAATAMGWVLTQSGLSQALAGAMAQVPGGRAGFLALSVVAFVVLGSLLEGIPAIVLFGPLLFPIARQMGVDEVHYAMVVVLAMGIGLFSPPFGVGYYAACAIGRVAPDAGMRRIWPYMAALAIGLGVVAAVPAISTVFAR
jgi:tripartite ATP-independent transporter DctM subunit